MREYNIYVIEDGEDVFITTKDFEDDDDATDYAFREAIKRYKAKPVRTIEEIKEEDGVTLAVAERIFEDEMEESVEYYAEPTDPDEYDEDDDYWEEDDDEEYVDDLEV